ncbi:hypothetical protein E2542_SST09586 [Spatholobus suberectus]|nr:hypothetical protein E2542_SST09586 [Spatholobus suberectus]
MALVKIAFATIVLALIACNGIFLQHLNGLDSRVYQERQVLINVTKMLNAMQYYLTVKENLFVIMAFVRVTRLMQA